MDQREQVVDYRNATYFGRVEKLSRQGNGILITDDSYILLANWVDNVIDGPYLYLFDGNFIAGTCYQGKLEGFNLFITPLLRIYASYKNNMMHGKCIIQDENGIKLFSFDSGKKVVGSVEIPYSKLKDHVWRQFGQEIADIPTYIERFLGREEVRGITRVRSVRISEHYQYYGTLNEDGDCEGLGFIINIENSEIYSSGNYKNGSLHGLARTKQGDNILVDGVFQNGEFKGSGVTYNSTQNNYTSHNDVEVVYGDPTLKIRETRREFHLRSLRFINQIIMMSSILKIRISDFTSEGEKVKENNKIMSNKNDAKLGNVSQYKVRVREASREREERDVREESSYDYDSNNMVGSSSPIRRINNLVPSRGGREEYRMEMDRDVKSISSMSKKSLTDNYFNRETKNLVRDLEQDSHKRIDLHQIYRQTKLKRVNK